MPWVPELFSAPALARLQDKRRRELAAVPFFDGLMAGESAALIESFAGEPELHHPVRGRIRGARAFESFVLETSAWLSRRNVSVEEVEHVATERRGFEEVILHLDGETGRIDLPVAIVADRRSDRRIDEVRVYFSVRALTGRHVNRPPLLQLDPELRAPDIVAEFQRALAAGDVDAIVATFEPDGFVREPAGGRSVHRGPDGLRAFYELLFSNDGGIPLQHCTLVDDGRACALEYNEARWGSTELPPQAGMVVHVRGQSGRLAAVRIYDDVERSLEPAVRPPAPWRAPGL
jgi:SnoaL-like domain